MGAVECLSNNDLAVTAWDYAQSCKLNICEYHLSNISNQQLKGILEKIVPSIINKNGSVNYSACIAYTKACLEYDIAEYKVYANLIKYIENNIRCEYNTFTGPSELVNAIRNDDGTLKTMQVPVEEHVMYRAVE